MLAEQVLLPFSHLPAPRYRFLEKEYSRVLRLSSKPDRYQNPGNSFKVANICSLSSVSLVSSVAGAQIQLFTQHMDE